MFDWLFDWLSGNKKRYMKCWKCHHEPCICSLETMSQELTVKENERMISKDDIIEAQNAAQNSADELLKQMYENGLLKFHTLSAPKKRSPLFTGIIYNSQDNRLPNGYVWIHFDGVDNKYMLEKAGMKLHGSFKVFDYGYEVQIGNIIKPSWWVIDFKIDDYTQSK